MRHLVGPSGSEHACLISQLCDRCTTRLGSGCGGSRRSMEVWAGRMACQPSQSNYANSDWQSEARTPGETRAICRLAITNTCQNPLITLRSTSTLRCLLASSSDTLTSQCCRRRDRARKRLLCTAIHGTIPSPTYVFESGDTLDSTALWRRFGKHNTALARTLGLIHGGIGALHNLVQVGLRSRN